MHVLHILEATQGGTRRHVLDLLPALQRRGIECDLMYSPARNPNFEMDAAQLRAQGVRTHSVPMARGFNPPSDARALRTLNHHLRARRYDAIHCHSTKAGLLGRLSIAGMRRRPRLIYTPHCVAFDTGLPRRIRRTARWLESWLAPLTQHFIAVSHHEKRVLLRAGLGSSPRVSTIHNGLDLKQFDALNALPEADHHPFTIGCFGRLTHQKNQSMLLRALALMRQEVPDARLKLVGGGEDEGALRALAARLDLNCIEWTGDVDEARGLYAGCDVVAQPSRWEGCPYSILEAMAARKTVIARSVGGVGEILDEHYGVACGFKREARVEELAWRLIEAARDPEWRRMTGEAARRRVEDAFQLAQMVDKTVAVYAAVTKGT